MPPFQTTFNCRDGLLCCGACNDGSIQMWDHRKNFVNTALQLNDAHGFGEPITGVQFGYDNRMLATRSNDGTLKLWDIRNFKKAVNVAEDLYSRSNTKNSRESIFLCTQNYLILLGMHRQMLSSVQTTGWWSLGPVVTRGRRGASSSSLTKPPSKGLLR